MSYPSIKDHKEVIDKCKGCKRIIKSVYKTNICPCHCFPETQWWFEDCPNAMYDEDSKKDE